MSTITQQGRGAWSSKGFGGTLNSKGTGPGPYYVLAEDDINQVGLHAWCKREQGQPISVDDNAVWHAVFAIQLLINPFFGNSLRGDGIFGPETEKAVKEAQKAYGLTPDGVVGSKTMKALITPIIKAQGLFDWEAVYGILQYEGGWDPGAVGYVDTNDLGLAQINTVAHPNVTFSNAFCVSYAVNFIAGYLANASHELNGDHRLAVASYNLGIGGARQWDRDGRPEEWLPSWSNLVRKPNAYIDRILKAHEL